MEQRFLQALQQATQAAAALGVRVRPVENMEQAHRILSGHKESDGFSHLARLGRLELSIEALAVKKQFTALFTDDEANNALIRLMDAGYKFS